MLEDETDPRAAEAEAYLRANGVAGITINGSGEDWFVSVGFAEHERFVTAYSAKSPLTPTDPMYLAEQALAALIRNERPVNKLAQESEAGEDSAYDGGGAEAELGDGGDNDPGRVNSPDEPAIEAGSVFEEVSDERSKYGGDLDVIGGVQEEAETEVTDVTDADFEESPSLGAELLEDDDFAHAELPAPEPEDFAPEELEPAPSGAFIFGDNLAHDRLVRIAQLAEHANSLIDSVRADYDEGEYNTLLGHVMTNVDSAGAYNGGDQAKFNRFVALDNIKSSIRRIEIHRDERQDFIRSADREAVASFEPGIGWP